MPRILAIDFGEKRIGLAITDEKCVLAVPLKTVQAGRTLKESAASVYSAVESYQIGKIVVGLPLLLNGKKGPMAEKVELFVAELKGLFAVPMHLFDERFTSEKARTSLSHYSRKKRKDFMDTTAALILLQDFLQSPHNY